MVVGSKLNGNDSKSSSMQSKTLNQSYCHRVVFLAEANVIIVADVLQLFPSCLHNAWARLWACYYFGCVGLATSNKATWGRKQATHPTSIISAAICLSHSLGRENQTRQRWIVTFLDSNSQLCGYAHSHSCLAPQQFCWLRRVYLRCPPLLFYFLQRFA